jgi:general nucleoside transport system permease protein
LLRVLRELAVPVVSVAIAIIIGSIIMLIAGFDPIAGVLGLLKGAFGGGRQIGETLLRSTPLIFTGLAVAYGFRAGLFNIGAEGQLFMGGLSAAFLGIALAGLPQPLNIVIMIVCRGGDRGAAWAFIPALLKAKVGAHEVITTMMFSYIARYLVSWLVTGPLKAEGQIPQTERLPPSRHAAQAPRDVRVPRTLPGASGLRVRRADRDGRLVGAEVHDARLRVARRRAEPVGIRDRGHLGAATTIKALCISGALAGLAGVTEVMGVHCGCSTSSPPDSGSPGSRSRCSRRTTRSGSSRRRYCSARCPPGPDDAAGGRRAAEGHPDHPGAHHLPGGCRADLSLDSRADRASGGEDAG